MKAAFLIFAVGLFSLISTVHATILSREVKPDNVNALAVGFDVQSTQLPDGDIQFIIKVSEKGLKFPSHVAGGLCIMKITPNEESSTSFPDKNRVKEERRGVSVTFTFAVTQTEIKNPNLCFSFDLQAEEMLDGKLVLMPSADVYYARLKNFLPSKYVEATVWNGPILYLSICMVVVLLALRIGYSLLRKRCFLRMVLVGIFVLSPIRDGCWASLNRSEVPVADVPDVVIHSVLISREYRESAGGAAESATAKGMTSLRDGISAVQRFTSPTREFSLWVLQAVPRARNVEYFIVSRQANRTRVVCEFWGESYSLNESSNGMLVLKTWANYGGGHLADTTYHYQNKNFVKVAVREERVGN